MTSETNYVVHYYVCDEASMVGGNWEEVTKAFTSADAALKFADKLPDRNKPATVIVEKTIKTFYKLKVK